MSGALYQIERRAQSDTVFPEQRHAPGKMKNQKEPGDCVPNSQQATSPYGQKSSDGQLVKGTEPLKPHRKENYEMIGFVIGLAVGSIIGISAMCILQINRDESEAE